MTTSSSTRASSTAGALAFALIAGAAAVLWAPADATGQNLFLDSRTGAVTAKRPADGGLALSEAEAEMLSMSADGLVVRRSRGEGLSVDLQGRFRHMATATISPDGELSIGCAAPRGAEGAAEK